MQKFLLLLLIAFLTTTTANANAIVPVDACASNPCGDGGTCVNGDNSYTCNCKPGHKCPHCLDSRNMCYSDPCQNSGECLGKPDSYACKCNTGYSGINCETDINDCANAPCANGGTCMDAVNDYTCDCAPGYTGKDCSDDINDCANAPCANGGTCIDAVNDYTCECAPGYTGKDCSDDINDCANAPCTNGGTCLDAVNDYTCECAPGYTGKDCSANINDCANAPCANGGTCLDAVNDYTCECAPGYTGKDCSANVNNCANAPCANGGTCIDAVNDYTCDCAPGYTSKDCSDDINDCANAPCANGGTCIDAVNDYTCECAPGYTGKDCSDDINDCANAPCTNGGTCMDAVNDYTCECAPGYTGKDCSANINDCANAPCANGGTCLDAVNDYTCECAPGYTGKDCSANVNDCANAPCANGGTCIDAVDDYACECAPGYTGTDCNDVLDVDNCANAPCGNGGTCINGFNDYTCECAPGYTGTDCSDVLDVDNCANAPCANGGTCIDAVNDYTCECAPGYTGKDCSDDINDCANAPCTNGGTCLDAVNDYTCECAPGYTGKDCSANINDCANAPCANGGTCMDAVNDYTCECSTGYTGKDCSANINDCANAPCANGGTCLDAVNDYTCECAPGYTGKDCSANINDCANAPCANGGTCLDAVNDYTCECAPGYTGKDCSANVNDCANAPCANGGTCIDAVNEYTCECAPGYTGTDCNDVLDVDNCANAPCANGGTCINDVNDYTCECAPGYTGTDCSDVLDVDNCANAPCANGGTCIDAVNDYTCDCAPGYTGKDCSDDINDCANAPCANGGTCLDAVNDYTCECAPGYTGKDCSANVNDCANAPCANGGTCIDAVNDYTCECAPGYTGTDCNDVLDVDNCANAPCANGGTCIDAVNDYTCECAPGYKGKDCSANVNDCANAPCANGGTCIDAVNDYTCECGPGYTGKDCNDLVHNNCLSNPCMNDGTCNNHVDRYECQCLYGYDGVNCERDAVVDGGWSKWSNWGSCSEQCGQGTQQRIRRCNNPVPFNGGRPCQGSRVQKRDCLCNQDFDAARDCGRCKKTVNSVGYVEDTCDCSMYYQCQLVGSDWISYHRQCPECLRWNQNTLSCSNHVDGCTARTTTTAKSVSAVTAAACALLTVDSDDSKYVQVTGSGNYTRNCAAGTIFDQGRCACVLGASKLKETPAVKGPKEITCIDFESGWNGMSATHGIYVMSRGVTISGNQKFGNAAFFNGSTTLEIPFFVNSYSKYKTFSVSFWYQRIGSSRTNQGLCDNGDCEMDPSIMISSQPNSIGGRFGTISGIVEKDGIKSANDHWHHVALTYDGKHVTMYLDGHRNKLGKLTGTVAQRRCPMVIGHSSLAGAYFTGYMDNGKPLPASYNRFEELRTAAIYGRLRRSLYSTSLKVKDLAQTITKNSNRMEEDCDVTPSEEIEVSENNIAPCPPRKRPHTIKTANQHKKKRPDAVSHTSKRLKLESSFSTDEPEDSLLCRIICLHDPLIDRITPKAVAAAKLAGLGPAAPRNQPISIPLSLGSEDFKEFIWGLFPNLQRRPFTLLISDVQRRLNELTVRAITPMDIRNWIGDSILYIRPRRNIIKENEENPWSTQPGPSGAVPVFRPHTAPTPRARAEPCTQPRIPVPVMQPPVAADRELQQLAQPAMAPKVRATLPPCVPLAMPQMRVPDVPSPSARLQCSVSAPQVRFAMSSPNTTHAAVSSAPARPPLRSPCDSDSSYGLPARSPPMPTPLPQLFAQSPPLTPAAVSQSTVEVPSLDAEQTRSSMSGNVSSWADESADSLLLRPMSALSRLNGMLTLRPYSPPSILFGPLPWFMLPSVWDGLSPPPTLPQQMIDSPQMTRSSSMPRLRCTEVSQDTGPTEQSLHLCSDHPFACITEDNATRSRMPASSLLQSRSPPRASRSRSCSPSRSRSPQPRPPVVVGSSSLSQSVMMGQSSPAQPGPGPFVRCSPSKCVSRVCPRCGKTLSSQAGAEPPSVGECLSCQQDSEYLQSLSVDAAKRCVREQKQTESSGKECHASSGANTAQ
ncbi:hypothetical protein LSAT2_031181 [Lamellibrachia satsuma]|nr:hypothetical protein LSAT2_031181 [Lamellibrachia satsuma]